MRLPDGQRPVCLSYVVSLTLLPTERSPAFLPQGPGWEPDQLHVRSVRRQHHGGAQHPRRQQGQQIPLGGE